MEKQQLQYIKLTDISVSGTSPRKYFDENELGELSTSIIEHGVLSPIMVRKLSEGKTPFELIAGERRYRASKLAKLESIPSIVVSMTDEQALEVQVIENLQRKDLSPMEEAESYESLIKGPFKYTAESIASKIGKSTPYVKQRLQLMKLSEESRKALHEDKIQLGHALLIARIEDAELQKKALKLTISERLTVKRLEDQINKEVLISLSSAIFKLSDAELKPEAGACTSCPYNTSNNKDLFEDVKGQGQCTNPKCFVSKTELSWEKLAETESSKGIIVIPIVESKKVFPYYEGRHPADIYVAVDDKCEAHPKKETFKKLFSGKIKEHVALDGQKQKRHLYLKKEIVEAMKQEKWYKPAVSESSLGVRSSVDRAKVIRENKRKAIANNLFEKTLFEYLAKKKSIPLLCEIIVNSCGTTSVQIARALSEDAKSIHFHEQDKAVKVIMETLAPMKPEEMMLFVIQELTRHNETLRKRFAKDWGLDMKKFDAQAKAIEEKEFKAKQDKKLPKKNEPKAKSAKKTSDKK